MRFAKFYLMILLWCAGAEAVHAQSSWKRLYQGNISWCKIIVPDNSAHEILGIMSLSGSVLDYGLRSDTISSLFNYGCGPEHCQGGTDHYTDCFGASWFDMSYDESVGVRSLENDWEIAQCPVINQSYYVRMNGCVLIEDIPEPGTGYHNNPYALQNVFFHPTDTALLYDFIADTGLAITRFTTCPSSAFFWVPLNWQILKPAKQFGALFFLPHKPSTMFLSADDSVWRSVDSGATWRPAANFLINQFVWDAQNKMLYGISGSDSTPGFFTSSDSGVTFKQIDTLKHYGICVDSTNGAVYLGTAGKILRSDDHGKNFYDYNNNFSTNTVIAIAANVYGKLVCASVKDGLFEINAPSVAPWLVAPHNDTIWIQQPIALQWNALSDAKKFYVQIAADSLFTTIVVNDSGITDTTHLVDSLQPDTKYFWRVRAAIDSPAIAGWSQVWNFITKPLYPTQVALMQPSNDSTLQNTRVDFSWGASQNEIKRYWFEIANVATFRNSVIDSAVTDTTIFLYEPLVPQTYWWRVRGGNSSGWGPFSATYQFNMLSKTGVGEILPRDENISLMNFPNPFSSTTKIFPVTSAPITSLKIFDALGREVADLTAQAKSENTILQFDAASHPAGMYICAMQCGENIVRKMMMVVR